MLANADSLCVRFGNDIPAHRGSVQLPTNKHLVPTDLLWPPAKPLVAEPSSVPQKAHNSQSCPVVSKHFSAF